MDPSDFSGRRSFCYSRYDAPDAVVETFDPSDSDAVQLGGVSFLMKGMRTVPAGDGVGFRITGGRTLRRTGFTLSEVLISIAVISIALLGLMASMLFGTRGAEHARRVSEASNYAREIVEIISVRNVCNDSAVNDTSPVDLNAGNYNGNWGVLPNFAVAPYKRQVTCTQVSSAGGVTLYQIRVVISWLSPGSGASRNLTLVGYHKS